MTTKQNTLRRIAHLMLALTLLWVTSCKNEEATAPNKYLVGSELVQEYSKAQLITLAGNTYPLIANVIQSGAKAYRVTYKTKNTDGTSITASGAVIIPSDVTKAIPAISYQHGTITSDASAPSKFAPGSESGTLGGIFAGLGYILIMPDYIGYGASAELQHPYEHRESLASASLDMLRATKELITQLNQTKWDNRLYLVGYSEGGFATMSLQKKIEEEAPKEFNLKASSCGAGAYNKTAFMNYLLNDTTLGDGSYNRLYLWVLLTYDGVYGLKRPMSYYFKEPYATQIAATGRSTTINLSFNTIATDSFKAAIKNKTDKEFVAAIADNDVYDWKPATPTLLVHGDADKLVFYFNSQTAYDAMIARGAANVKLERLAGKDHSTATPGYIEKTYLFILSNP